MITSKGEARFVILSIHDFRKLRARASCRVAQRIEDMPDELFEEVRKAIEAYEREDG